MTESVLTLASLAGRTGRGVRIAIVDSGVHAGHPHIGGIRGGVAFDDTGGTHDDIVDRLGHGTAVAAVIHEKAPDAELWIAKVFDRTHETTGRALVEAIRWAVGQRVAFINLSLGTTNLGHSEALAVAVREAAAAGAEVVAAAPTETDAWLPGGLPDVIAVELDWTCPRDECHMRTLPNGARRVHASGYPRPIPGVPPERNVKGQSFAVANATALLALAMPSPYERVSNVHSQAAGVRPPHDPQG